MRNFTKYISLTFFLVGMLLTTQAQNLTMLEGKVLDTNGIPVKGAYIYGDEGNKLAISAEDGAFVIEISKSKILLIEKNGYQSKKIHANDIKSNPVVQIEEMALMTDKVVIPFAEIEKRRVVGSLSAIDVEEDMVYDQRQTLAAALNGKIPGLIGNYDVYGLGNATVVVDGIPREAENVNLTEIQSITVLKDAISRMMYGAAADKAVILVTTKRGEAMKKDINIMGEYGISTPKALPNYLGSADYMSLYNQALLNDGKDARYTEEEIAGAAAGTDPVLYPDEDYYGDRYLKSSIMYQTITAQASGGNQNAQYYVNLGWKHNEGWMNQGNETTNILNIRANVDYQIHDNLKMSMDVVALYDMYKVPNVVDVNSNGYVTADFWDKLESNLPNSFPVTMPVPDSVSDELLGSAVYVDGDQLLGGTNTYTRNLYGDMLLRGTRQEQKRTLQFNTALDWDLHFITPGLKARGYLTFDFYNKFVASQQQEYAVYSLNVDDSTGVRTVNMIGKNAPTNKVDVREKEAYFQRRVGAYLTLSYDRVFGDHAISANALAYRKQMTIPYNVDNSSHAVYTQDFKNLHFGARANYMFNEKYLAEAGATILGTQKLAEGNQYTVAPAVGLGWIASNEDFLNDIDAIDYLKVRGSYGVLKNDDWDNYFLYETSYQTGGWFNYGNTTGSSAVRNREMNINGVVNDITWQARKELNIGAEALLLDKKLWIETSYFNSAAVDHVTEMKNLYPTLMGGISRYANYNSFVDQGAELGIKYTVNANDLKLTLGTNMVYAVPKITKMDEPSYAEDAQYRYKEGKVSDGIWGLEADGLFGESDFDGEGNLNASYATPTFGAVQAGDIKYVDQNGDGVIDADDQILIGNNSARFQYSTNIRVQYKNFDLFILGIGQTGQEKILNNSYYWTYGEMKYGSNHLDAYGVNGNTNVNAALPRLSSTKNNNNYRTSTFWMYSNQWFNISNVQLTYHFNTKAGSALRGMKAYVRASDVLRIDKNKEYNELNVSKAPQTRSVTFGIVASF